VEIGCETLPCLRRLNTFLLRAVSAGLYVQARNAEDRTAAAAQRRADHALKVILVRRHLGKGQDGSILFWLPGREQVSRFFPALGRTAICPARDGAIPYAEAGSW